MTRWDKNVTQYFPIFVIILIIAVFFSGGIYIGYRIKLENQNLLLNHYKQHSLDLSENFIGAKPLALRYFYSLKQGILRSAVVNFTLYGRLIHIGPLGDKEFVIKLKHIPDDFRNTFIADDYKDVKVKAVYRKSGIIKEIQVSDLKIGDEVEILGDLDFITALETVKEIKVYYD